MCEKLQNKNAKNAKKGDEQRSENLMIKENYFKRIEYCGGNDLASKWCFRRFWLIGRRKGSVQLSTLGTVRPISQKCTISCERHCAPIALSFYVRFRFSDPPVHNLSEQ